MTPKFYKDPDELLDYKINWVNWLNGDVIITSTWEEADGITVDHDEISDTYTVVWLGDGLLEKSYRVTNHIITLAGRKKDQSILIRIREN